MGKLLDVIKGADARAVVVCQIKPITFLNVSPFNEALHHLIINHGGVYGCDTQVRMSHLAYDGFHVTPDYAGIIDRTYACAIMREPVPCPTPAEEFITAQEWNFRRDWPRVGDERSRRGGELAGGAYQNSHGGRW